MNFQNAVKNAYSDVTVGVSIQRVLTYTCVF